MTRIAAQTKRRSLTTAIALVLAGCGGTTTDRPGATPSVAVHGKVGAGPTCPVERVGQPCPPRPVIATVRVSIGRRIVASTRSEADGRYALSVPTGRYTMSAATADAFPRCDAKEVNVIAGPSIEVDFSCDTGIR